MTNRVSGSWLVVLCLVGAAPLAAQEQAVDTAAAHRAFLERNAYVLRDGGRWSAPNPDHDPAQARSPSSFGYRFSAGRAPGVVRLQITGAVGGETVLYWDGFYFWHPLRNRVVYASQGTGGAVALGESVNVEGSLVFDLILPDGRVEIHRDTESRTGPDAFVSRSYRLVEGTWQPVQTLAWTRVRGS